METISVPWCVDLGILMHPLSSISQSVFFSSPFEPPYANIVNKFLKHPWILNLHILSTKGSNSRQVLFILELVIKLLCTAQFLFQASCKIHPPYHCHTISHPEILHPSHTSLVTSTISPACRSILFIFHVAKVNFIVSFCVHTYLPGLLPFNPSIWGTI